MSNEEACPVPRETEEVFTKSSMRQTHGNKPLWTCPQCKRQFANQNQSHACARYTLAEHLEGKSPEVLALYHHLEAVIQGLGTVIVNPEKTRIAFQVRMSFAAVTLKRQWIDGHVVLARRLESPRFRRIETLSPRNHVHSFRLTCLDDIDEEFMAWLAEAYQVGEQRHL
jgi:Domain of unknown function (DUF5655)